MGGKKWKSFMAKLYGFGAAIVIVGAMFKIMHWPGAGPMLVVGLSTEAVIFFFSAFEPPHEDVDWSLVYPELAGMHGEEGEQQKIEEDKGSLTEQLDTMLEDAKIGPELMASLGDGLRSLSDQAGKLNNITDASDYINFKPVPGTLIMFPSYLSHGFQVDFGLQPFRFIHFNYRAIEKKYLKDNYELI